MQDTLTLQDVRDQTDEAIALMKKAGFPLTEEIGVALDDKLPYMGYTTEHNGKPLIVVSKKIATKQSVMGLLIHELSHRYRMETKHPSHNNALLDKAIQMALGGKGLLAYQWQHVHNVVNSIEDLYADDISFRVFAQNPERIFPGTNMNEFFLSWVRRPDMELSEAAKWKNADNVVSAAFAKANLDRHNIPDTGKIVEKAIAMFLKKLDKKTAEKYGYFENFMVQLPEKISDVDFGQMMVGYLREFLQLTAD